MEQLVTKMETRNFDMELVKDNYVKDKERISFYVGLSELVTSVGVTLAGLETISQDEIFPKIVKNIIAGIIVVGSLSCLITNIQLKRNENYYQNELKRHT